MKTILMALKISDDLIILLVILGIIALIVSIILLVAYNNRCKNCDKWWCEEVYKNEFIETVRKKETEHIYTDHIDTKTGRRSYSVSHVPVTVTYDRCKVFMRCKYCGYEWTDIRDYKT